MVIGRIGIKGTGPMMQGSVFFFDAASGPPPSTTKYWRVPTHVFKIDSNARFSARVPEGTYYLGALETKSGEEFGPPQDGDYYFFGKDGKGNPKLLTVWRDSVTDLGMLNEAEQFKSGSLAQKGITAIQGVLRDEEGKPVKGMVVFAFSVRGSRLPLFVSEGTGNDGKYLLRLHKGGKYYVLARERAAAPSEAEITDMYQQGKPVVVKTGQTRTGINITVLGGE
jgi:hypothetical protein